MTRIVHRNMISAMTMMWMSRESKILEMIEKRMNPESLGID